MRKPCPTGLTDQQWAIIEPLIPVHKVGRPRQIDIREVLNAIFYQARAGCQWDMLPHDLLPRSTVNEYFNRWKADGTWQKILDAIRQEVRVAAGRDPNPSTAAIDSQTVKGTEVGGERGYDGGKKLRGIKRRIVVDSLGLLLVVAVTAASADDGTAAPGVLRRSDAEHRSRLVTIRGDQKYRNHELERWRKGAKVAYRIEVVERPAGSVGFVKLPKRRVVERTFGWLGRYRRLSRDYEWDPRASESFIKVCSIHRMLNRPSPNASRKQPAFRYRESKAQIPG